MITIYEMTTRKSDVVIKKLLPFLKVDAMIKIIRNLVVKTIKIKISFYII